MRYNLKVFILFALILVSLVSVFLTGLSKSGSGHLLKLKSEGETFDRNVWVVFTRADERRSQASKLANMLESMLELASVPITLNVISDQHSQRIAEDIVQSTLNATGKYIQLRTYKIESVISKIEDIVSVMKPHFSPKAGSYYSDSLFYISLGLHRVAPHSDFSAVLLDIDLKFQQDIESLFEEFNHFSETHLFGLAPELAPVYYHLLSRFRTYHSRRDLDVGLPCCAPLSVAPSLPSNAEVNSSATFSRSLGRQAAGTGGTKVQGTWGRPGLNSGVVLLRLDRIRSSVLFKTITTPDFIATLTDKYFFKGHLGDQDLYSLLSWEIPSLIKVLDCGWNRQLCTWWRDHGYRSVHSAFSHCPSRTKIFHANCNSQFPTTGS